MKGITNHPLLLDQVYLIPTQCHGSSLALPQSSFQQEQKTDPSETEKPFTLYYNLVVLTRNIHTIMILLQNLIVVLSRWVNPTDQNVCLSHFIYC